MPSERIQYMAWSTSSRMRRASSSPIRHPLARQLPDRRDRGRVGCEVEWRRLRALGSLHVLVPRDHGRDLEIVGRRELADRLELRVVADLVGDQADVLETEVAGEHRHPPPGLERLEVRL